MGKKVIFLDRDGVINEDSPDYIRSVADFRFLPGSAEAIGKLCHAGFEVMLITNQSIIGRGLATEETLQAIFDRLRQGAAAHGGTIRDIFYCPHRPDTGCSCRKPQPGLFLKARDTHALLLEESVMVGDSAKDMAAARAAGVGTRILVLTGNGRQDLVLLEKTGDSPDFVAADLAEAVDWILRNGA